MVRRFLDARDYTGRWAFDLERAGLSLRPGEYFLLRLVCAAFGALVPLAITRGSAVGVLLGIVTGAVAYMLPAWWVRMRGRRRTRQITSQLVETTSLIASALRAGFAFSHGVDVAAQRVGPPMSEELNRMMLDISLGSSTEDALAAMNERIGSDDVDMVVSAVLIQRTTGGNLAEVLERVTETMRERERIHGEIRTMTASQQLTGWVLSIWPMVLALAFFAIAPNVMKLLFTEPIGLALLGLWFTLNVLGALSLKRILSIDF
jgi:tight adherence protein B